MMCVALKTLEFALEQLLCNNMKFFRTYLQALDIASSEYQAVKTDEQRHVFFA